MSRTHPENPAKLHETIGIGGFLFSLRTHELRDAGGAPVPLRAQSAEVLAVLAAAPGDVVSKETLIDRVWPDTHVTDDSLVQCIADIRRALDDSAHRLVQTVPKKGYRLFASAPGAVPRRASRLLALGAALVLLLSATWALWWLPPARLGDDIPSIAVLPFEDYSAGADKGFLSDAIAEGIITALARYRTYAVIARNSSFQYRDKPADVRAIGKDLGVDYVLEGSQQKIGDRLKVTAQLIDATDGAHLWARSYDRGIADLFVVQEEIIQALAFQVGEEIERPPPGSDPERVSALHYYLAGADLMQTDFSAESNRKMREMAAKAIEADPTAPYGYINMAWSYRHEAAFRWAPGDYDRAEALRRAAEYADKAIALAPDESNAHGVRARIHAETGESEAAITRFEHAIALNPSDSALLVGSTTPLLYTGRADEAIARIETAKGLDPLYPDRFDWQMGWALWEKRDCEGALRSLQRMAKIPVAAHAMLAAIHACLGHRQEAQEALAVFHTESPARTLAQEREAWVDIWTGPGSLDRWIEDMRFAGMPD